MQSSRFRRNEQFFGAEGQRKIRETSVAVVGVGGLGTHVVQQLALLGVGSFVLIDDEELADSNRNRYIGARFYDLVPGTRKTAIGRRLAGLIDPSIKVAPIDSKLRSKAAFDAIANADWVFGCVDNDGSRLVLTEACAAFGKPLIDLASDIFPDDPPCYGGRICILTGNGCLSCLGIIDAAEASRELQDEASRADRNDIYGIDRGALDESGPSVVSINGAVASLGVTEFMVAVTGLRPATRHLVYYGHSMCVRKNCDHPPDGCYYCDGYGAGDEHFDLYRYIF